MPVLRSSPSSPFGRKIKIAAKLLGLMDRMTIELADTANPDDSLRNQNPLGKIPALVLDDGSVLYDSRVITEYLDFMAGGGRLLPEGDARFPVLRLQALADGIVDAAILQVYEKRFKPEEYRFPDWLSYQQAKVTRGLDWLEENTPAALASSSDADAGTIALACALGYLDLRFAGEWREGRPNLVAWLESFEAAVPVFTETKLDPAPVPAAVATLR